MRVFLCLLLVGSVGGNASIRGRELKADVAICHDGKTITVNANAVAAHVAHGDTEGPCKDPPTPVCEGVLRIPVGQCEEECFDCNTCPDGYNDGCNVCSCDKDSPYPICTKIACFDVGEPFCLPGCTSKAPCVEPKCGDNEYIATPGGECCPRCIEKVDCRGCDGTLAVPPGKCEEECFEAKDCNSCPGGFSDGCNECTCDKKGNILSCTERYCFWQGIPHCIQDCSKIDCPTLLCQEYETQVTLPGDCCPACVVTPDCSP